jgi:hypothetical protein
MVAEQFTYDTPQYLTTQKPKHIAIVANNEAESKTFYVKQRIIRESAVWREMKSDIESGELELQNCPLEPLAFVLDIITNPHSFIQRSCTFEKENIISLFHSKQFLFQVLEIVNRYGIGCVASTLDVLFVYHSCTIPTLEYVKIFEQNDMYGMIKNSISAIAHLLGSTKLRKSAKEKEIRDLTKETLAMLLLHNFYN